MRLKNGLLALLFALPPLAAAENHLAASSSYMLNCQGCHRPDGSGLEGSVPSMREFVGNFLGVEGGREYLVQVPGSANAPIDDAELAQLLNWILTTMSEAQLPVDFVPYTGEEIASMRYEPLQDVAATREALLRAIEP